MGRFGGHLIRTALILLCKIEMPRKENYIRNKLIGGAKSRNVVFLLAYFAEWCYNKNI